MEVELGSAQEAHALAHAHRQVHHIGRVQRQNRSPEPACTSRAFMYGRDANALTPRCWGGGQRGHFRPRQDDRETIRGGEDGSSRVQQDGTHDGAIPLSDDLLRVLLFYVVFYGSDLDNYSEVETSGGGENRIGGSRYMMDGHEFAHRGEKRTGLKMNVHGGEKG
jgi:hypothetical protein